MRCPWCQQENPPGSNFCLACGTRLAQLCPACRAELPAGSRFCTTCGRATAASPDPTARFAPPAAYTPKHLAEKILRSRAALEGERKQVTVLFADLKGSMELLADRDPEEARRILDPVLNLMMEAVHRYEGTVNQVMGDGIMALFGAPIAREDHAVRACYAALRMQEAVKRYAGAQRGSEGLEVQIRVGLNSGEVVVRSIGSDLRMDYTAVGQTTHLAGRMEQLANPGSILISTATRRLAEGYVELKPLGSISVKGLGEPVDIFEVVAARPAPARRQALASRTLTRFVGREAELEALSRILDRVRAGRGEVAALVGEPGVGKSRLVRELIHSGRTQGWLVLESDCPSYGMATPYLAVIELARAYFQIEPGDDARAVREKVAGKLLGLERALEPDLPAILALLDVPVEDAEWQGLDPQQRRQRILRAMKHLLVRESHVQPLCVVVEDLHWADPETRAVLDSVVESLMAEPILLLVNYRPELQHQWSSKTCYSQLQLDALTPERAEELLRALLGADPRLEPVARLLIARTDGNPFFLEESVRSLAETGSLDGAPGAYHLARPIHAIQVPPTVEAVLAARIDGLPPEEKNLLQTASVVGQDVPFLLLRDITDVPEDELRHRLARLQTAEFLHEARLFPELEYTFTHSLTHEVAYRSLLQDVRRGLHARIADGIERLYPAHLAEQVDRLAHHAMQGEVWSKAVPACRQAGAQAFARSSARAAVAWFERALQALEHLPGTRERLADAVDLRLDLRYSLIPLGELRRVIDELYAAERLAQDLGDQPRLGTVAAFLSNYFTIMGDLQRGVEYGRRALAIADALGELSLRVLANGALAMAHGRMGDYRQAIEFARANVAALQGELLGERFGMAPIASVYSRTVLMGSLAEVGEFAEAGAIGEEAVRIAEAARHSYSICFACQGLGALRLRKGELPEAIAVLERALTLCQVADVPLLFPVIVVPLASAYAASGRVPDALALLDRGVKRAASLGDSLGHWLRTGGLSEALLAAGRIEEAVPLARQAIEMTRFIKARGVEAWALRLLAEITSRRDPPDAVEPEACYREACAIADELGMRPLAAHCHLGLGRLYRRTGERGQARAHLTMATATYHDLDMRSWLKRAEAERAASG